MMLYPPMADLAGKVGSRYLLVNLLARRARELSADPEKYDIGDQKPVSHAIEEVYAGKLTVKDVYEMDDPELETVIEEGQSYKEL